MEQSKIATTHVNPIHAIMIISLPVTVTVIHIQAQVHYQQAVPNRVEAQVRRRQAVPNQVVVATLEAGPSRVEAQVHIAVRE